MPVGAPWGLKVSVRNVPAAGGLEDWTGTGWVGGVCSHSVFSEGRDGFLLVSSGLGEAGASKEQQWVSGAGRWLRPCAQVALLRTRHYYPEPERQD